MQRSYRVRDDLASAILTKFLLETIYPFLREKSPKYKYTIYKFGV